MCCNSSLLPTRAALISTMVCSRPRSCCNSWWVRSFNAARFVLMAVRDSSFYSSRARLSFESEFSTARATIPLIRERKDRVSSSSGRNERYRSQANQVEHALWSSARPAGNECLSLCIYPELREICPRSPIPAKRAVLGSTMPSRKVNYRRRARSGLQPSTNPC
jgi:hypothetical protein